MNHFINIIGDRIFLGARLQLLAVLGGGRSNRIARPKLRQVLSLVLQIRQHIRWQCDARLRQ
jgi:hypothetical protein